MNSPGKTIPRSILLSLGTIAVLYVAMNLSVVGVVPWREFASPSKVHATDDKVENRGQDAERGPSPAEQERQRKARFVVSIFMERIYGGGVARAFTLLILWTTFASCLAALARVFENSLRRRTGRLLLQDVQETAPHWELPARLVAGDRTGLDRLLRASLGSRHRRLGQQPDPGAVHWPDRRGSPAPPTGTAGGGSPYRIWLYPLPSLVALVGWTFVFVTSDPMVIGFGLAMPVAGVILFFGWSWRTGRWPFA